MELLREYGKMFTFNAPLQELSSSNIKQNPTLAAGDFVISKDGGSISALASLPVVAANSASLSVAFTISTTEAQAKRIDIIAKDQTSPREWKDNWFKISTYGDTSAQHSVNLNTTDGFIRANLKAIEGDLTTGNNATLNLKQLNIQNTGSENPAVLLRADDIGLDITSVSSDAIGLYATTSGARAVSMVSNIGVNISSTSIGVNVISASTDAVKLTAAAQGINIDSVDDAINAEASNGHGIYSKGNGTTHDGMRLESANRFALGMSANTNFAMQLVGDGGIQISSSSLENILLDTLGGTANMIKLTDAGGSRKGLNIETSDIGINVTSSGNDALKLTGNASCKDISAKEIDAIQAGIVTIDSVVDSNAAALITANAALVTIDSVVDSNAAALVTANAALVTIDSVVDSNAAALVTIDSAIDAVQVTTTPISTDSIGKKTAYLFQGLREKTISTASKVELYTEAGTKFSEADITKTSSQVTRSQFVDP